MIILKFYRFSFIVAYYLVISLLYSSLTFAQKQVKAGCISGNCDNGTGKFLNTDSSFYEGGFKNGKQDGLGVLTDAKGNIYRGEFKENLMQGKGKYFTSQGSFYEGDFLANKFDGQGIFVFPDGKKYKGAFKNGKIQGLGKMEFADGFTYIGNWDNNKKNGAGKLINKLGEIEYNGDWLNDEMVHPEQSTSYLDQLQKFYTKVLNNKTFEGSQEIEMIGQRIQCGLTLTFEVDINDLRLYGTSVLKIKDESKYYTKTANFEGKINPIDKTIFLSEKEYISKSELPSPLMWHLETYEFLINNDAESKGYYILSNVPPKSNLYSSPKAFLIEKRKN